MGQGLATLSAPAVGQGLAALSAPAMGVGGGNGSAINCKHCDCGGRPPYVGGVAFFTKVARSGTCPVCICHR